MITPERIEEIGKEIFNTQALPNETDRIYRMARELFSELKDSLSREKKKREEVSRFASKLTEWIEEQIA